MTRMLIFACAFACFNAEIVHPQTGAPSQVDLNKAESARKSAENPAAETAQKVESGAQTGLGEGRIGILQSRNPLESGLNAHAITSRAFINYVQLDFTGGIFLPSGDLAGGMDSGSYFGINMRTPFTHLVLPSQLGESARYFGQIDAGLHFSYLTGESSARNTDSIAFASLLLDLYYTLPFDTGKFKVYMYNGLGISLVSTVVVRDAASVHKQSFAFTVRPGAGVEYFFSGRVYARINAGYFVCMESVVAMGVITSFGAGYLF